jgi:hypothetical protein
MSNNSSFYFLDLRDEVRISLALKTPAPLKITFFAKNLANTKLKGEKV